jgi:hypothetical protein
MNRWRRNEGEEDQTHSVPEPPPRRRRSRSSHSFRVFAWNHRSGRLRSQRSPAGPLRNRIHRRSASQDSHLGIPRETAGPALRSDRLWNHSPGMHCSASVCPEQSFGHSILRVRYRRNLFVSVYRRIAGRSAVVRESGTARNANH